MDKDSLDFSVRADSTGEKQTAQDRRQDMVLILRNLQTCREDTFNKQKQSSELIIMTEHIGREPSQA